MTSFPRRAFAATWYANASFVKVLLVPITGAPASLANWVAPMPALLMQTE